MLTNTPGKPFSSVTSAYPLGRVVLTNRNTTRTEVSVHGLPGHLYTAQEGSSHTLVWFDQESGTLSSCLPNCLWRNCWPWGRGHPKE